MNTDFFKGFLAARGVQLPDASLDMNQCEEAMTEAVRKHVMDLDGQIATLKAQVAAANQKLQQLGQGVAVVANSALANSVPSLVDAKAAFNAKVREIEIGSRLPFDDAWAAARAQHPALYAAMNQPASVLANALETVPPFPGKKPEIVTALGLTPEADGQVFEVAWRATRGKLDPADSLAIFRQVRAWLAGFDHITPDQAEDKIEQEFPALFAAAQKQLSATLGNTLIAHPGAKLLLGIPANASPEEFSAALEGNGRTLSPRNARGIWEALLKWLAKERGRGTAGVEKEAAQRYPELARALGIHPV